MTTTRELITGSLRLINVVQANENPTADDMDISLKALNAMIDSWSTEKLNMFLMRQYYFQLVAGQKEYTLGAGGNWNIARPMQIEKITTTLWGSITYNPVTGLNELGNNPTAFDVPMEGLTDAQYAAVPVKNQTAPYPLKFYDNGNYPLRTVSMWPIPTTNPVVTLWLWQPLADLATLDVDLVFPKGYERALRFGLALELGAEFGKEVPVDVIRIGVESKAHLKRLNSRTYIMRNDIAISVPGPGVYNYNLATTIPN